MLNIRPGQMQAFRDERHRLAVQWAWEKLNPLWPEILCGQNEPHGRARISEVLHEAEPLLISSEADLLTWLGLALALVPEFPGGPQYRWAANILGRTEMPAKRRLDAVVAGVSANLREVANG